MIELAMLQMNVEHEDVSKAIQYYWHCWDLLHFLNQFFFLSFILFFHTFFNLNFILHKFVVKHPIQRNILYFGT